VSTRFVRFSLSGSIWQWGKNHSGRKGIETHSLWSITIRFVRITLGRCVCLEGDATHARMTECISFEIEHHFHLSLNHFDFCHPSHAAFWSGFRRFSVPFPRGCPGKELSRRPLRPALTCRALESGPLAYNNHGNARQLWRTSPASRASNLLYRPGFFH
jgi:hypothetical protein